MPPVPAPPVPHLGAPASPADPPARWAADDIPPAPVPSSDRQRPQDRQPAQTPSPRRLPGSIQSPARVSLRPAPRRAPQSSTSPSSLPSPLWHDKQQSPPAAHTDPAQRPASPLAPAPPALLKKQHRFSRRPGPSPRP